MSPIPAKVLTVAKQHRGKLSEMPDPEWYLKQFRSHIGMIHELFKVCPPQRWKALSWSIGDALAKVGEKAGMKAGHYIHIEDMSRIDRCDETNSIDERVAESQRLPAPTKAIEVVAVRSKRAIGSALTLRVRRANLGSLLE